MLRSYFPKFLNDQLFGERELYGKKAWENDEDWKKWNDLWTSIYQETQHNGIFQELISRAGYKVLNKVDLKNKKVVEIGAGEGPHLSFFNGIPETYTVVDVCSSYFSNIEKYFLNKDCKLDCKLVHPYIPNIDLPDSSQDIVISFYSLEHLYPFQEWLSEIFRILKPGGALIGAIPSEGGMLWGLGRWFTSRRVLKKRYGIPMKKIICWSHPNMCDEIVESFFKCSNSVHLSTWPIPCSLYDFSLIMKFIVFKK